MLYLLVPVAALATLLGGWLVVRVLKNRGNVIRHLSGLAAGYLVAVTLVRLLPEAFEQSGPSAGLWALGGFLIVHFIEHGISPHFHYGEESHVHEGGATLGVLALVGLSLHSFMDGMSLTAAAHTHSNLGLLVFLGILLHRIPEGATISSIFLARGFSNRGALVAATVLAVAAVSGALTQKLLRIPLGPALGLAAGLALYVASSDLLPEAQKEKGWKSTLGLLLGTALFLLTARLAPHDHAHEGPEPLGASTQHSGH